VIDPAGVDFDDPAAIQAADTRGVLREVASAAARVRAAAAQALEVLPTNWAEEGRPRSIVVLADGADTLAGQVLAALSGGGCPVVPLIGPLPPWVGATDLVVAVSADGEHAAVLDPFVAAARRGPRLLAVGPPDCGLSRRAAQARSPYVAVAAPRDLWSLTVPLLAAADLLRLLAEPLEVEAAAMRLEHVATACHPSRDSLVNPGSGLALALATGLPQLLGCSPLAAVAARAGALACAMRARSPALHGIPGPEQLALWDGPYAAQRDIFADPEVDDGTPLRLAPVLLRDPSGEAAGAAETLLAAAEVRGLVVREIAVQGVGRLERLASLVGVLDYAAAYLGLSRR
jgi:hypothetical protein